MLYQIYKKILNSNIASDLIFSGIANFFGG